MQMQAVTFLILQIRAKKTEKWLNVEDLCMHLVAMGFIIIHSSLSRGVKST
jgi:hypothetical protein